MLIIACILNHLEMGKDMYKDSQEGHVELD